MSEEIEGQDTGAEAVAGGADPVAVALALGGASREDAHAFLKKQGALIDDQRHHLHEQLKQLHLGIWEKRIGVMLRLATLVVGIGIAAGLGLMVWDAAHSKGLLIEPFSVPPDMAAKGLTGQVVAAQLLDRLAQMTASESSRSTQSYANNWGNDIKVEIPETGVSISELEHFLREWLGHDTRISGEVYRTATGIAVTTRAGANGATFAGAEGDLDTLVQKGAEHVFESTQPYRYANYLDRNYNPVGLQDRIARATAIYRKLIAGDDPFERAWAWNGLGTIAFRYHKDDREAIADYRNAIASIPDFTIGWFARAFREVELGHDENVFEGFSTAGGLLRRDSIPDLNPHYIPYARLSADTFIHYYKGDFAGAAPIARTAAEQTDDFSVLARNSFQDWTLQSFGHLHDAEGVQSYLHHLGTDAPNNPFTLVPLHAQMQDWQAVRALEPAARRDAFAYSRGVRIAGNFELLRPFLALARAHLGDFAGAKALIAPSAGDNDDAARARAQIAEMEGNHARADWWFARSEAQTPSIPFTDTLWGQALLARGVPDAAVEKFKLANRKGPKFADPLEGWGEALMAKNQSHLALAKFSEAYTYAPNWGRLHLKWGEALAYAGKPADAKAQFARAAALDLTPSEKSELARVSRG
jgi:tetratricopeptide (TPR) repeat protein